jgi:SAM-dependent methyltransferase
MKDKTMNPGDNAGFFPDKNSVQDYLNGENNRTTNDYHLDRLRALEYLLQKFEKPKRILDFGCGNGMYINYFWNPADLDRLVGVDMYESMLDQFSLNLQDFPIEVVRGDARSLSTISGDFDLILAIDVLGYLNDNELKEFYTNAHSLLKNDGYLVVMYGNELFDMFALNQGTVDFFRNNFDVGVANLLVESNTPRYLPSDRRNPLNFASEIAYYGFKELLQSFSQWHKVPPGIGNKGTDVVEARLQMRDHSFDPNTLNDKSKWKALFRSSIFASLSQKKS